LQALQVGHKEVLVSVEPDTESFKILDLGVISHELLPRQTHLNEDVPKARQLVLFESHVRVVALALNQLLQLVEVPNSGVLLPNTLKELLTLRSIKFVREDDGLLSSARGEQVAVALLVIVAAIVLSGGLLHQESGKFVD
jgi:hypothetical protein